MNRDNGFDHTRLRAEINRLVPAAVSRPILLRFLGGGAGTALFCPLGDRLAGTWYLEAVTTGR